MICSVCQRPDNIIEILIYLPVVKEIKRIAEAEVS
jgi:hypothetical protein